MYVKESLDKIVYQEFITGFYSCSYRAGQVLDPAEIAQKYGTSRTPVVQALKRLAAEKIIGVRGNGRFYIPVPTEDVLRSVCRTRILFEQEALEQVILKQDTSCISCLREMAERCSFGIASSNSLESVKKDMDFHRLLVASAGNSCMQELYEIVLNRYISIKYVLTGQYISQRVAANRHIEMMEYVESGNVHMAKECLDLHISKAMENMIATINAQEEL